MLNISNLILNTVVHIKLRVAVSRLLFSARYLGRLLHIRAFLLTQRHYYFIRNNVFIVLENKCRLTVRNGALISFDIKYSRIYETFGHLR